MSDFFTVAVLSLKGLLTFHVLFVIDLPTRPVTFCGMTTHPDEMIWRPPRSPNMNADAGLFIRSVKEECLSKLIPIGRCMLRRSLREFTEHYHLEREHQGIGNRTIVPFVVPEASRGTANSRRQLGGLLNYYYRAVA